MGIRSLGYDTEALDTIICYFMKTILRLQNSGVENLPLENNLPAPYHSFLDTAMKIFLDSPPPELARLILNAEYDALPGNGAVPAKVALGLQVIKELSWHIHYDEDYYGYLLSLENIWGNTALEYAAHTFYPNLPENIKHKYHIDELIKFVPENMLRLNDY